MMLGITIIIFVITNVVGDPVALLMDPEAPKAQYEMLRHQLGLDRPFYTQYLLFLKNVIQGDFGRSFQFEESAMGLVWEHLPATVELAGAAVIFAIIAAIPVGIVSAVRPYSLIDRLGRLIALVGQAAPGYWLGIIWLFPQSPLGSMLWRPSCA
jgi:peptide/nickel transport system permease protein